MRFYNDLYKNLPIKFFQKIFDEENFREKAHIFREKVYILLKNPLKFKNMVKIH